jgi:hypothetical protein
VPCVPWVRGAGTPAAPGWGWCARRSTSCTDWHQDRRSSLVDYT